MEKYLLQLNIPNIKGETHLTLKYTRIHDIYTQFGKDHFKSVATSHTLSPSSPLPIPKGKGKIVVC